MTRKSTPNPGPLSSTITCCWAQSSSNTFVTRMRKICSTWWAPVDKDAKPQYCSLNTCKGEGMLSRYTHHRHPRVFWYHSVTSILRTNRLCEARRAISPDFWRVGGQETTLQWTVCCTCFNGSYSGSRGAIW